MPCALPGPSLQATALTLSLCSHSLPPNLWRPGLMSSLQGWVPLWLWWSSFLWIRAFCVTLIRYCFMLITGWMRTYCLIDWVKVLRVSESRYPSFCFWEQYSTGFTQKRHPTSLHPPISKLSGSLHQPWLRCDRETCLGQQDVHRCEASRLLTSTCTLQVAFPAAPWSPWPPYVMAYRRVKNDREQKEVHPGEHPLPPWSPLHPPKPNHQAAKIHPVHTAQNHHPAAHGTRRTRACCLEPLRFPRAQRGC